MENGHGFGNNNPLFLRQLQSFIQFLTVQSNRFLHQDMFPIFNGLFHKLDMSIMRRCNIDHIHFRIREHFIKIRIHLFDPVFFSKLYSLFVGSVSYCVKLFSIFFQCRCHFIGDHTCSQYSPVNFSHPALSFPAKIFCQSSLSDLSFSGSPVQYNHKSKAKQ